MKQILKVEGSISGEILEASNVALPWEILLSEIEGWENYDGKVIATAQKLIGRGSYVIARNWDERTVAVTVNTMSDSLDLRDALEDAINDDEVITLTREFYDADDNLVRTETLEGEMRAITGYEAVGEWATITFSVLCFDPDISVS